MRPLLGCSGSSPSPRRPAPRAVDDGRARLRAIRPGPQDHGLFHVRRHGQDAHRSRTDDAGCGGPHGRLSTHRKQSEKERVRSSVWSPVGRVFLGRCGPGARGRPSASSASSTSGSSRRASIRLTRRQIGRGRQPVARAMPAATGRARCARYCDASSGTQFGNVKRQSVRKRFCGVVGHDAVPLAVMDNNGAQFYRIDY
jgi:hypothetical protein